MVKCDEVLVSQTGVVKIGIRIYVGERGSPLFVNIDNDVPETGQAVDVDDNDKDQFEKLESVFHVLCHIHALNNSTEARNTHQLQ